MNTFSKNSKKNIRKKTGQKGPARNATHSDAGGFTLIETLVAISIFTLSVLVMLSVLSRSINDTEYAKKKLTASYLAQEGIEYVRNMRDSYMLYSSTPDAGWAAFNAKLIAASCQGPNGCYFNPDNLFSIAPPMPITQIPFSACGASCTAMLYDSNTGRYNYTTGTASGYVRRIRAVQIDANETKIFSTVFLIQNSVTYSINFSESVYNWIE